MSGYLTPSIEKAIPFLEEAGNTLMRQDLILALTQKTKEWCEGDPELAENILDGKKSLEGCVKYVLEQAATIIAKNVAAMPQSEFNALPKEAINGKKATMAGGMLSDERTFELARDYYYKAKETKPNAGKGKKNSTAKKAASAEAKAKGASAAVTPQAANEPEQMTLLGAA